MEQRRTLPSIQFFVNLWGINAIISAILRKKKHSKEEIVFISQLWIQFVFFVIVEVCPIFAPLFMITTKFDIFGFISAICLFASLFVFLLITLFYFARIIMNYEKFMVFIVKRFIRVKNRKEYVANQAKLAPNSHAKKPIDGELASKYQNDEEESRIDQISPPGAVSANDFGSRSSFYRSAALPSVSSSSSLYDLASATTSASTTEEIATKFLITRNSLNLEKSIFVKNHSKETDQTNETQNYSKKIKKFQENIFIWVLYFLFHLKLRFSAQDAFNFVFRCFRPESEMYNPPKEESISLDYQTNNNNSSQFLANNPESNNLFTHVVEKQQKNTISSFFSKIFSKDSYDYNKNIFVSPKLMKNFSEKPQNNKLLNFNNLKFKLTIANFWSILVILFGILFCFILCLVLTIMGFSLDIWRLFGLGVLFGSSVFIFSFLSIFQIVPDSNYKKFAQKKKSSKSHSSENSKKPKLKRSSWKKMLFCNSITRCMDEFVVLVEDVFSHSPSAVISYAGAIGCISLFLCGFFLFMGRRNMFIVIGPLISLILSIYLMILYILRFNFATIQRFITRMRKRICFLYIYLPIFKILKLLKRNSKKKIENSEEIAKKEEVSNPKEKEEPENETKEEQKAKEIEKENLENEILSNENANDTPDTPNDQKIKKIKKIASASSTPTKNSLKKAFLNKADSKIGGKSVSASLSENEYEKVDDEEFSIPNHDDYNDENNIEDDPSGKATLKSLKKLHKISNIDTKTEKLFTNKANLIQEPQNDKISPQIEDFFENQFLKYFSVLNFVVIPLFLMLVFMILNSVWLGPEKGVVFFVLLVVIGFFFIRTHDHKNRNWTILILLFFFLCAILVLFVEFINLKKKPDPKKAVVGKFFPGRRPFYPVCGLKWDLLQTTHFNDRNFEAPRSTKQENGVLWKNNKHSNGNLIVNGKVALEDEEIEKEIVYKKKRFLDIIDFGIFSALSYEIGGDPDFEDVKIWYPNETIIVKPFFESETSNVAFLDIFFPEYNSTIISIRGTFLFEDMIQDAYLWKENIIVQIASYFSPFLAFSEQFTSSLISYISFFQQLFIPFSAPATKLYAAVLEDHINRIIIERTGNYTNSENQQRIYLTGHSLGGFLAKYVAIKHNLQAITFSAPGIFNSRKKLGVDDLQKIHSNIVNVKSEDDLIPKVEKQESIIQLINCNASGISCHNLERTVQELIRNCGSDELGRYINIV